MIEKVIKYITYLLVMCITGLSYYALLCAESTYEKIMATAAFIATAVIVGVLTADRKNKL